MVCQPIMVTTALRARRKSSLRAGSLCIRVIASSGVIKTIAGTGTPGYSGDNGPAINAQFNTPQKLALDVAGNLYIADVNNNRVRKIDTTGRITTFAGTGSLGTGG